MYLFIKKTIKKILPDKFLVKNEYLFRKILSMFYAGSSCQCKLCGNSFSKFIKYNEDLLCPQCGSSSRNRRLNFFLESINLSEKKVLHFSPNRIEYKVYKERFQHNYTASDFANEFIADEKYDITDISVPDNHFDLIICYHILEHIKDDLKAMKELKRVVTEDGFILVQTPFQEKGIYEDYSITDPEERKLHFGQEDHLRIYSCEGLKERLESAGLKCKTVDMSDISAEQIGKFGFNPDEKFIMATK